MVARVFVDFHKRYFTLATIAAAAASLTQVIAAGIFCAVHTDVARFFAAYRARKCSYFHQASSKLLARLLRRFHADHTATALRFGIRDFEILLNTQC